LPLFPAVPKNSKASYEKARRADVFFMVDSDRRNSALKRPSGTYFKDDFVDLFLFEDAIAPLPCNHDHLLSKPDQLD
jgi:hypothetical protein